MPSYLIPDWHKHDKLLIGWPHRHDTWRQNATPARQTIRNIIHTILQNTRHIHLVILVHPKHASTVQIHHHPSRFTILPILIDDCWIRDTGPLFAASPHLNALCYDFNAWGATNGGCYTNFTNDAALKHSLSKIYKIPSQSFPIVLEGGSISCDGRGTLLTTKQCLLHPNRNPHLTPSQIQSTLLSNASQKIIWLPYGSAFDTDTDGHVDTIAVFTRPEHVALLWSDSGEQHERSRLAEQVIQNTTDATGRPITIHRISAPPAVFRTEEEALPPRADPHPSAQERPVGERLCASYVNFLIVEDCVVVPIFGNDRADRVALQQLDQAFGFQKRLLPVNCREIVLAGGGVHCLTLGVPTRI